MDRKELARAAYDIFLRKNRVDREGDPDLWRAIAETDDYSLADFVANHSEEEYGTDNPQ